jgi:protein TonB
LNIIYTWIVSSEVKDERLGVTTGAHISASVRKSHTAADARTTSVVRAVPIPAPGGVARGVQQGRSFPHRASVFAVVLLLHGALIARLLTQHSRVHPPVLLSALQVHVVSDLQRRAEAPPLPTPALERPVLYVVAPQLPSVTPAPDAPSAAPVLSAAPAAVAVPAVTAAEAPPQPVTPPRFDAAYLKNPPPAYPAASRRQREQGTVVLRVLVSQQGLAAEVIVEHSSGSESLDAAAMTAVRHWRFVPAHRGSESIDAWVLVPVGFELQR